MPIQLMIKAPKYRNHTIEPPPSNLTKTRSADVGTRPGETAPRGADAGGDADSAGFSIGNPGCEQLELPNTWTDD